MKLRLASLWFTVSLAACGGRSPLPDHARLGVGTQGAPHYGTRSTPPPHPIGAAVCDTLGEMGIEVVLDPALSYAAHLLAPVMDENQSASRQAVSFSLSHAGIHYPVEHISGAEISRATAPEAGRILGRYLANSYQKTQFTRLGLGVDETHGIRKVMLLLGRPLTSLTPIARSQPKGHTFRVSGALSPGYSDPRIMVTNTSGAVGQTPTHADGERYLGDVQCPLDAGRIQVEVLADGTTGPTVVANFPVWCGVAPTATTTVPIGLGQRTGETPQASEQILFQLINDARLTAKLPPLEWDESAAEIARSHSRDMAAHGFVGHVSAQSGGPKDRAKKGGLVAAVIRENIGLAGTEAWIHAGLMASPGHRRNILSGDVQSVGVGVIHGRKELYATQVFVGRRDIGPTVAMEHAHSVARTIDAIPRPANTSKLVRDPALDAIAQSVAVGLTTGEVTGGQASKTAFARLKSARLNYASASVQAGVADAPRKIVEKTDARDPTYQSYGVGVAGGRYQGRDTFFVVVMYAGR